MAPSLEEVVDEDPYLSLQLVGGVQHIKMDVQQLLQDAGATAAAAGTAAAAHEGQLVSIAGLLAHVSSRVWYGSNDNLVFAKRTLASHLVRVANPTDHRPLQWSQQAYTKNYAKAGMMRALRPS
jgi:hypothetical protein